MGPTRCRRDPVTAQVRATLPVLGGIWGETRTTWNGGSAGASEGMAGIGIVSNPRSWRNRRHPETADRLRRALGDEGELREAETPEALSEALTAFARAGIDVLAVNGGDGTLHLAVTAMAESWRGPWPRLLPLRGGTMNTIASAHRLSGAPEALLSRLLQLR